MPLVLPLSFARHVPGKVDKSSLVEIEVTDMEARDALWWDRRMGPHHVTMSHRADRFWPWSGLLPMCHLTQLAHRRACRPLVVWAQADNGNFVRVAMMILIERYPHLDVHDPAQCYFIWFMSSADRNTLIQHFAVSNPPELGAMLLDSAMVLSANDVLEGRIGLHSDDAGGEWLRDWYRKKGLLALPTGQRFPQGIRRRNNGGFFYTDPRTAEDLLHKFDTTR
jgi:hypothetical protein